MPRAFLINPKRHSLEESLQDKEKSPEFHVNTAESIEKRSCCLPSGITGQPLQLNHGIPRLGLERVNNGNIIFKKTHCAQKGSQNIAAEHVLAGNFKSHEQCEDEFYNLTKLAEVSLAAAAGQLFYKNNINTRLNFGKWPEQEFPEDLSRDVSLSGSSDSKPVEIHVCPECEKRYSTSSNLARHRQTHRSLADKKARTCPHCDKIYVSMPAFSMHVRTHNQGCKCPYCGKCFSRPWLLQGHIRTHTGEKPFKCSVCTKAFADKSNLRAHVQTHSNMKPFVCGRCGKAFALKSYLYKHEESSCMRRQSTIERKFSEQGKKKIPPKTKSDDTEKLPVKSIPTPVISIAIKINGFEINLSLKTHDTFGVLVCAEDVANYGDGETKKHHQSLLQSTMQRDNLATMKNTLSNDSMKI